MSPWKICLHWAGSSYKPSKASLKAYHRIIDGDLKTHHGNFPIDANKHPIKRGHYAAHVRNFNTHCIGVAIACMGGKNAHEKASAPNFGSPYPLLEGQFEAACEEIATICIERAIYVSNETVFTHAEVQGTFGVEQGGKWDISVVGFKITTASGMSYPSGQTNAKIVGNYLRERVRYHIARKNKKEGPFIPQISAPDTVRQIQALLNTKGYDLEEDNIYGPRTETAIRTHQKILGLPETGLANTATLAIFNAPHSKRRTDLSQSTTIKAQKDQWFFSAIAGSMTTLGMFWDNHYLKGLALFFIVLSASIVFSRGKHIIEERKLKWTKGDR